MYQIYKYCEKDAEKWDEFVMSQSVNGTFLQTRRFLNYHPIGRFVDASYMIYDEKNNLVAVCPACEKKEEEKKVIVSHAGSTYGGIIVGKKCLKVTKMISLIKELEDVWKEDGYNKVMLKQTPDLFTSIHDEVIEYAFDYCNYRKYTELNMYVDLETYSENILSEFAQGKRTQVNKCNRDGWYCRKIDKWQEIKELYDLLVITLEKYEKKPVHTVDDLYEFQNERLRDECECFGAFFEGKMVGGCLMFYFNNSRIAHTQYLCADPEYNSWSAMTYMYYSMIKEARDRNYKKLSWGIVTEDLGRYLNEGLATSKERFGSRHSLNFTYEKVF